MAAKKMRFFTDTINVLLKLIDPLSKKSAERSGVFSFKESKYFILGAIFVLHKSVLRFF